MTRWWRRASSARRPSRSRSTTTLEATTWIVSGSTVAYETPQLSPMHLWAINEFQTIRRTTGSLGFQQILMLLMHVAAPISLRTRARPKRFPEQLYSSIRRCKSKKIRRQRSKIVVNQRTWPGTSVRHQLPHRAIASPCLQARRKRHA